LRQHRTSFTFLSQGTGEAHGMDTDLRQLGLRIPTIVVLGIFAAFLLRTLVGEVLVADGACCGEPDGRFVLDGVEVGAELCGALLHGVGEGEAGVASGEGGCGFGFREGAWEDGDEDG
jgi:hypothetical protein